MLFSNLKNTEVEKELDRSKFSKYIPMLYGNSSTGGDIFLNQDNTIGYAWEIMPVPFLSDEQAASLEQLLNMDYPKGTVIQFILHADENINPIVDRYLENKTLDDPLIQTSVRQYADFVRKQASGMTAMAEMPIRNYRSFVFVKSPSELDSSVLANMFESLNGANLYPFRMTKEKLISWYRQYFNSDYSGEESVVLDDKKFLKDQIIKSDSIIDFKEGVVKDKYFTVVTPKSLGKNINTLKFNRMFGAFAKASEDTKQIVSPYIFSMNIVFDNVKRDVGIKSGIVLKQKFGGSFAVALNKRIKEFTQVSSDIDDGAKQVRMIPSMIVYDTSKRKLETSISRVESNWLSDAEGGAWMLQRERKLSKICMLMSLPFGLYNVGNNVSKIDRDFINSTQAVSKMLPVQAEFKGTLNDPSTLYLCRRGQLAGLNIAKTTTSMNFLVSAESGGGKSYFLNKFIQDERARKSKVRVLDIGGSYKKLALANSGRYIDFVSEKICINPIDFKTPLDENGNIDQEDYDKARDMAVVVISEMVYSASGQRMEELEYSIVKKAVDWALEKEDRRIQGVDSIIFYLNHIKDYFGSATDKIINIALEMSVNLTDFGSEGRYGNYFCGKSNFDISTDEFVVIELERVRARRELFGVVVMQMLNLVTADLYLGDRSTQTLCLFEEVASLLNKQGQSNLEQLGTIIDEGYRRARKYKGAFGVVLQSLLDLGKFGNLGDVIRENSAYKFLLQGKTYREAADKKLIPYYGLALDLAASVKNNKPRYSEILVDSPFGIGVYRLYVDPWTSAVCSSEPSDTAKFESLLKSGHTPLMAISELSGIRI